VSDDGVRAGLARLRELDRDDTRVAEGSQSMA
jgi:hypothetical protein